MSDGSTRPSVMLYAKKQFPLSRICPFRRLYASGGGGPPPGTSHRCTERTQLRLNMSSRTADATASENPSLEDPRAGSKYRVLIWIVLAAISTLLTIYLSSLLIWRHRRQPRTHAALRQRLREQADRELVEATSLVERLRQDVLMPSRADALGASALVASGRKIGVRPAESKAVLAQRRKWDVNRSATAHECYTLNGETYRGHRRTTKSGLRCQQWAQQTPNKHVFDPARYRDAGLEDNFCRNPDGDIAPWCYNGEGTEPRFETCAIPVCAPRLQQVEVPTELLAHSIAADRFLTCPTSYMVDAAAARAIHKYDALGKKTKRLSASSSPLHYFSFYGNSSPEDWDHIVRVHASPLRLRRGQAVFESGAAAGAFVDSLSRQYAVRVAGVDGLVHARARTRTHARTHTRTHAHTDAQGHTLCQPARTRWHVSV